MDSLIDELNLIERALDAASGVLRDFTEDRRYATAKAGGDPVTEADLAVDAILKSILVAEGYGWLSEETADTPDRLDRSRVWVVDPLDGTREFVRGIPEWCVSIGLVVDGRPEVGGIVNPATGQRVVGAIGHGVRLNGNPVHCPEGRSVRGALILASRTEVAKGQWDPWFDTDLSIRNVGSVAYKLGLVAAGLADATWTLVPKNEWDVAAGAALVMAAGGVLSTSDWETRRFNQADTLLPGFVACRAQLFDELRSIIDSRR